MKELVDVYFPDADIIRLVVDNLNIHNLSGLYEVFEPQEAGRIVLSYRVALYPLSTPVGLINWRLSYLSYPVNVRERRIPDQQTLQSQILAWEQQRNSQQASVNWRFKATDARSRLKRLYPCVEPGKVALADY